MFLEHAPTCACTWILSFLFYLYNIVSFFFRFLAFPSQWRTWFFVMWKPKLIGGQTQPIITESESEEELQLTKPSARKILDDSHDCISKQNKKDSITISRFVIAVYNFLPSLGMLYLYFVWIKFFAGVCQVNSVYLKLTQKSIFKWLLRLIRRFLCWRTTYLHQFKRKQRRWWRPRKTWWT